MFRTNLVVHHQERGIIYCITQFGTIVQASLAAGLTCTIVQTVPIVLRNTVHYAVLMMMID